VVLIYTYTNLKERLASSANINSLIDNDVDKGDHFNDDVADVYKDDHVYDMLMLCSYCVCFSLEVRVQMLSSKH